MPSAFYIVFWLLMTGRMTPGEWVSISDTVAHCQRYAGIVEQWKDLRPREFENDLDTDLVLAVMAQESHCLPGAISDDGWASTGLMQVIPRPWTASKENLMIPRVNIYWGMWILDRSITRADGDIELALAAYNCGFEKVEADRCGPHGGYAYADKVLEWKYWFDYSDSVK